MSKSGKGRGDNPSNQLYVLRALNKIYDALTSGGAGGATEATLQDVKDIVDPVNLEHNTIISSASDSVPAGSLRGSVLNNGANAGVWNGVSLPAGVTIPWGDVWQNTYGEITFNATNTQFIIEYTTKA